MRGLAADRDSAPARVLSQPRAAVGIGQPEARSRSRRSSRAGRARAGSRGCAAPRSRCRGSCEPARPAPGPWRPSRARAPRGSGWPRRPGKRPTPGPGAARSRGMWRWRLPLTASSAALRHALLGLFGGPRLGHAALGEALRHVEGAAHQVAEVVGQVGVDPRDQGLLAEARVEAEDHVAQQEVAEGLEAVALAHDERRDHVAEGLRDLSVVHVPVAVDVEVAGRLARSDGAEHGGPEDRVGLEDVLGHQVLAGAPELSKSGPSG